MTNTTRAEQLVAERLMGWLTDPNGLDWDLIDADDPPWRCAPTVERPFWHDDSLPVEGPR